jgi:hypothetical protein
MAFNESGHFGQQTGEVHDANVGGLLPYPDEVTRPTLRIHGDSSRRVCASLVKMPLTIEQEKMGRGERGTRLDGLIEKNLLGA